MLEKNPVEPNAAATRWRGERMDYHLGVWVLCNQAARAARNTAENVDGDADDVTDADDVSAETFATEISPSEEEEPYEPRWKQK